MNSYKKLAFLYILHIISIHSMEPCEEKSKLQRKLSGAAIIRRFTPASRTKSDSNLPRQCIDPRKELETDYVGLAKHAIQDRDKTKFDSMIAKMQELQIDPEMRAQLIHQWDALAHHDQSQDSDFFYNATLEAIENLDSVKYRWSKERVENPKAEAQLENLWDIPKKHIPAAEAAIKAKDEEAFQEALSHIPDKKTKNRLTRRWNLYNDQNVIKSHRFPNKGSVTLHRRNQSQS